MKRKILATVKMHASRHPLITALLITALVVWVAFIGCGLALDALRGRAVDSQITPAQGQARAEAAEASAEHALAGEAQIERRVEDRVREQTIRPELHRTARQTETARARVAASERTYEDTQKPDRPRFTDDAALYARNCADYALLYPGRKRAGCR